MDIQHQEVRLAGKIQGALSQKTDLEKVCSYEKVPLGFLH